MANKFLAHLMRGGSHGYYWSASEAKDEQSIPKEKITTWWSTTKPSAVPSERGQFGMRHLYFGVHPTTGIPKERRTRKGEIYTPKPTKCRPLVDEIAAINCLFGEFDAKRFPDAKAGALAHIEALSPAPSVIIDSGGGYHCYWLLDEPFGIADDTARAYARRLQYAWVVLVGSDDDAKDLARVLRVPGTHNYKEAYGPDYPLVDWIRCEIERTYLLTDLEDVARPYIAEGSDRRQSSDTDPLSEYERVEEALQRMNADRFASYQGWIDIGMALASWDSGYNGLSLWDRYSRLKAPAQWESGACEAKWATFQPKDISIASIFHWAAQDAPRVHVNTNSRSALTPTESAEHFEDTEDHIPLLISARDLHRIPPAIALIPDVFFVNTLHQLFGAPGSGKSLLALDVACTTAQAYPVVYVAAEAIEDYEARVNAWCAHHGRTVDNLYFWREPLRLGSEQAVHRFIAMIAEVKPGMIFLDPLADCMTGLDESSADDMSLAIYALNTIRRHTRAAIAIVHHTGWNDERERGSSLLRAACRIVVKIEMRDDGLIRFTCIKKNQGQKFAPRLFRLVEAGDQGSVLPLPARMVMPGKTKPTERILKVLEALTTEPLRNGATHTQVMQDTQIPAGTLNRVLTACTEAGYIRTFEEGKSRKYKLTNDGQDALDMALEETGEKWKNSPQKTGTSSTASFNWFLLSSTETGLPDAPSSNPFQGTSTTEASSSKYIGAYRSTNMEGLGNGSVGKLKEFRVIEGFGDDVQPSEGEAPPAREVLAPRDYSALDWEYLRGRFDAMDMAGINTHCAMRQVDPETVLLQLESEAQG
jgi:predicted transcriptional regulator